METIDKMKVTQEPSAPSTPTIKQLFARSGNRCSFPKCSSRIVQGNTVIGKICHIKAAKQGGPRYDPAQTAADRHASDNLILLCGNHHTVIDSDEEAYTVDRLLKMKADHEQGVPAGSEELTEQAVGVLIDQCVHSVNQLGGITAHRADIKLGGQGGTAPGAGGGGGGVIGSRVGGGGGEGGKITVVGCEGQAPGAGGGGAGAIDNGAVGGEGGSGGECIDVFISPEELQELRASGFVRFQCEVGRGGRGNAEHGEDGEDTIVKFVASDGTVLKSITAKGAKAARWEAVAILSYS